MSYAGPPPTTPPPPDWQPRLVVPPEPPRRLPAQDHPAIDTAERAARQFTWILAAVAATIAAAPALVLLLRLVL